MNRKLRVRRERLSELTDERLIPVRGAAPNNTPACPCTGTSGHSVEVPCNPVTELTLRCERLTLGGACA